MLFYGGGVVFGARFGAWLLAAASASAAAAAAAASASLPPTPAAWNSTAGIMSGGADSQAGLVSNSSSGSSSANASSVFAFSAFACVLTIALTIALRRADWLQVRGQMEARQQQRQQ